MPLAPYTPIRRIITGHDPTTGAAVFSDDHALPVFNWALASATADPLVVPADEAPDPARGDVGFVNLFRTTGFPASDVQPGSAWQEVNRRPISLSDRVGTTLRAVDLPPGAAAPMHRTLSLDFGVVLRGEVVCALDAGAETVCREGDVVVQRGTIHAWYNRTAEPARVLFVLVPAEPVKIGGKELGEVAIGEAPETS